MLTLADAKIVFADLIKDTPLGKKMIDDQRAAVQASRAAEVKAVAEVRARLARGLPPLREKEKLDLDGVKKAKAALTLAEGRWLASHRAARSLQLSCASEIDRLEGLLSKSADPSIYKFLADLRDLAEQTHRTQVDSYGIEGWLHGSRVVVETKTNFGSIRARLASIQTAIAAAEGLLVAAPEDLVAEIEKIRGAIPEVARLDRPAPASAERLAAGR